VYCRVRSPDDAVCACRIELPKVAGVSDAMENVVLQK